MSYDLKTCNNLPQSSSSSCSDIYNPDSSCKCHACCLCRSNSCPDNFLSPHTYAVIKKICYKILKDYRRRQNRESYTLFEGGNSINVRVHRRRSCDEQKMRFPDLSGKCGRGEGYDRDESRRRCDDRDQYQKPHRPQSKSYDDLDPNRSKHKGYDDQKKVQIGRVSVEDETTKLKRKSLDKQEKGPQKPNGTQKKRDKNITDDSGTESPQKSKDAKKKSKKGKGDGADQAEDLTQKEREKQTHDNEDTKDQNQGKKKKDNAKDGKKKKDDNQGKQEKDDKTDTSKTKDGKQEKGGKPETKVGKQEKDDKTDASKTKGGKQVKDDKPDGSKTKGGKEEKDDKTDAGKTKGGKQVKDDKPDGSKTKGGKQVKDDKPDGSKTKGGKEEKDDKTDAGKTKGGKQVKDDKTDATKTKGGKQGKDDHVDTTKTKDDKTKDIKKSKEDNDNKKNVREENLKDKKKSDNINKNKEKNIDDNVGVGGKKSNVVSNVNVNQKTQKPPIKAPTTKVNKPKLRTHASSSDYSDGSSEREHFRDKKKPKKSPRKLPIVDNLREKVRRGEKVVPSPKITKQHRDLSQQHKGIRTSTRKPIRSKSVDQNARRQIPSRGPRKFQPNAQGGISSKDQRLFDGRRYIRHTRWDEAKPHDYLRASMEQRDCMRRCNVICEPCTPRSTVCNFSRCDSVNTCNADGPCCF